MIETTNHLGSTIISEEYFANLIGKTVTDCYGVVGMANSGVKQNVKYLVTKKQSSDTGIKVKMNSRQLVVDIHIVVLYGMNITTIVKSIVNKVKYTVKENTGFDVKVVNVYVDNMTN